MKNDCWGLKPEYVNLVNCPALLEERARFPDGGVQMVYLADATDSTRLGPRVTVTAGFLKQHYVNIDIADRKAKAAARRR